MGSPCADGCLGSRVTIRTAISRRIRRIYQGLNRYRVLPPPGIAIPIEDIKTLVMNMVSRPEAEFVQAEFRRSDRFVQRVLVENHLAKCCTLLSLITLHLVAPCHALGSPYAAL
jgi:hypothetical protein